MKKTFLKTALFATITVAGFTSVISCNDDSTMEFEHQITKTFTIENVVAPKDFVESGSFQGVSNPEIYPGQSITFKFSAGKTQKLMFATMYGLSKDWFFASKQPGLDLFDSQGNPVTGDVSSQIRLWDNGTKNNTSGATENNAITEVSGINAADLMKVTLDFDDAKSEFTLTLKNISGGTSNETPFSPGVWAVSNYNGSQLLNSQPFFSPGSVSNPEITDIAQSGNVTKMIEKLNANTQIMTGLSPALVVVYKGENPIFKVGQQDAGKGLKEISQFGNTSNLLNYLKTISNVSGVYVAGNAPITPGKSASTQIQISAGDKIAFVTMFGFSNDWFYANESEISAGNIGNLTSSVSLFDSGTGINQYPGAGNHQALFGGIPQPENIPIAKVGADYPIPSVINVLKITLN